MDLNVNELWTQFMEDGEDGMINVLNETISQDFNTNHIEEEQQLSISTKTMIAYLNQTIDIKNVYWQLPILYYHEPTEGIIKKQIKITCTRFDEIDELNAKIKQIDDKHNTQIDILKHIEGETLKDVRKINIGLCKKDLMSYRTKKKSAFYNCFVVIMRIKEDGIFKEIHVKVFNTGKMEIPGIKSDETLFSTLNLLCKILNNYTSLINVNYSKEEKDIQTVLINSNFHCGYTVNREILYERLKFKYGFNALYDPCKYPGVQCKFYYNKYSNLQNGICDCETPCSKKGRPRNAPTGPCMELSFMVFRTGSILIVGNCKEHVLRVIFERIKKIMCDERENCMINLVNKSEIEKPQCKKRNRKIKLLVDPKMKEKYHSNSLQNQQVVKYQSGYGNY
jgi:TATA-box binding protein (TBP) (component of TFIID and TFIIIB)